MELSSEESQALELFKSAGDLEQQGKLKEAVKVYKKAYQLNEKVDILYRKLIHLEIEEEKARQQLQQVEGAIEEIKLEEPEVTEIIDAESINKESILNKLPIEIIARVLAYLAEESPRDYKRAVRAGRLFWIPNDSALFWEPICKNLYANADDHLHRYEGWADMFRKRPHLRFNGVYVSVCTYLRYGEQEHGSWYPSLIEVTYYRYLRFFHNGTVTVLLTSKAPQAILPFNGHKQGTSGFWQLNEDENVLEITSPGPSTYEYHMNMKVASSGSKVHNKLKWIRYWNWNNKSGEEGEFSLRNEKSFYFQKC